MVADDSGSGMGNPAEVRSTTDRGARAVPDRDVGVGVSPSPQRPLYGLFYGVTEPPFDLTPNPRFLFLPPRHREALAHLRYGLTTPKGFMLLIGEAGTGKTTLVRTVLEELGHTANRCVFVHNPTLQRGEFYEYLARELALTPEARTSKTRFLADLQRDVEGRFAAGGITTIVIDEAQSMPDELLEEVRLLGNIESATVKFLNIALAGQPELAERLNAPGLRQLKQRLALRCELPPLTVEETASYVSSRLRIAGGSPKEILTREAVMAIHEASAGIPRTINVLCDNTLVTGFAAQVKPINIDIVEEVCRDFQVGEHSSDGDGTAPPASPSLPVRLVPVVKTRPEREAGRIMERRASSLPDRPMFGSLQQPKNRRFRLLLDLCNPLRFRSDS
jgi:type II secretory pathway predicted ATPase ExeA